MRSPTKSSKARTIRCAIYTRKSSEEGLEQEFNSLDAQREACEAYIASQKHEGWVAVAEMYDDGGISGGTMERPALKRLLSDIEAARIDTVVVYKVDRLTRSLGDFAKIVEVFDAKGASFVSVTQQFNTTSSMGRLTLNMLLSFAQFEREVTGERIRDKIAASKKKGMWMGGVVPLGYDAEERKLVINEAEAQTVRHIYRLYAALGSVQVLKGQLDRDGIVSKRRIDRFERESGAKPIARGALYLMLRNRIYLGEIVHKDESYPGQHDAIVDPGLWDIVQGRLAQNRVERNTGIGAAAPSLLAGLIHDDVGERMTPTHTNKKGTRYRYYVSHNLIKRGRPNATDTGRRIPAGDVEELVEERIIQFLNDEVAVFEAVRSFSEDVTARLRLTRDARELADGWRNLPVDRKRGLLCQLIDTVTVQRMTIETAIRPTAVPVIVDTAFEPMKSHQPDEVAATITLSIPAWLKRVGMETKLLIDGVSGGARREPDRSLLRLLALANRYREILVNAQGRTVTDLAAEAGVGRSYFCRVVRLSFLAPDITHAISRGNHPLDLTAKRLTLDTMLPIGWTDQKVLLGIN